MGIEYTIVFQCLLVLSLTYNANAQAVFDITKYGAKGDGSSDSSQGLTKAWTEACASGSPSRVLVPKGIFLVMNANLRGPCKAAIGINLQGTLKAPADQNQQSKSADWISIYKVDGFTLSGGGTIDGNGQAAWGKKKAKQIGFMLPTSLGLNYLTGAVIEDITSINAKMFHINVFGSKDVTLQRLTISAPGDSPNTDGIHMGRSSGVKVLGCKIKTGDDCVSIGDGSQQVTVNGVTCGPGHGLAVGSLGKYPNEEPVTGINIKGCTLTNTENGLRVKTWQNAPKGYLASDIHFEDITLDNVTFPINIDQEYCPSGNCPANQPASKIKLDKISFKGIKGTSSTTQIVKLACSKSNPCTNVEVGDISIKVGESKINVGAPSVCKNVQPKLSGTLEPKLCAN